MDTLERARAARQSRLPFADVRDAGQPARATRRNTERAYARAWAAFERFAGVRRTLPASPELVADYLKHLHGESKALRTIKQHKAAIRLKHHHHHYVDPGKDPLVQQQWKDLVLAHAQQSSEEPRLTLSVWRKSVEAVIDAMDAAAKDVRSRRPLTEYERLSLARDRALILVTASYARLTTSEIRSLHVEQLVPEDIGYSVLVRRSPDDAAFARTAYIRRGHDRAYCAVSALDDWLRVSEIRERGGSVFRGLSRDGKLLPGTLKGHSIRQIIKERCRAAGITNPERISVRALRRGSIQQGAYDGQSDAEIVDAAGLSPDSLPLIAALTADARERRRERRPAPAISEEPIPVL